MSDTYRLDYARPDGELLHLEVLSTPVRAADGTVTANVIVIRDDSDRVRIEAELTRQALTDPLTGLPNRATLRDRLTQALARAARHPGLLAVLFVDLDRFKQVNDAFGHAAGDSVLRISAARMTRAVRPGDTVGRFGGDEFVVLCEDVPDVDEAVRIAERLHAALNPPVRVADNDVTVTASIGVAVTAGTAGTGTVEPDQLLHRADLAMYRAKRHGRARYQILGVDTATNSAPSSARPLADLRAALAAGDLVVHYQPRIDLRSGHPVGAEALRGGSTAPWAAPPRRLPRPRRPQRPEPATPDARAVHRLHRRQPVAHPTGPGTPDPVGEHLGLDELGHPQLIDRVARTLADTGLAPWSAHPGADRNHPARRRRHQHPPPHRPAHPRYRPRRRRLRHRLLVAGLPAAVPSRGLSRRGQRPLERKDAAAAQAAPGRSENSAYLSRPGSADKTITS